MKSRVSGAIRTACLTSVLLLAVTAGRAESQALTTVQGTVVNEGGRPMEYVQVALDPAGSNRQVRTDRDGRFSFAGVPAGPHVLRVTWIGYAPDERTVEATSGVLTVEVTLRRLTTLGGIEVTAKRSGLFGAVYARDSLKPVPDARIEVIGSRKADSTTVDGAFNLPDIKPGAYLVRVRHPFFQSRNVPVVVPRDGAAELDIVVDRGRISRDQHMEMLYREMDSRLNAMGDLASMVTRDELRGKEKMPLDMALQQVPRISGKAFLLPTDICLFVDGVPRPGLTIQDFAAEDIEAVEVYAMTNEEARSNISRGMSRADPTGSLQSRWPPRARCGVEPTPAYTKEQVPRSRIRAVFAVVWLRR